MSQSKDNSSPSQKLMEQDTLSELIQKPSHIYVEKGKQLEDATSTAWVFTLFGIIGLIFVVLSWTNIFFLEFSFYFKILYTIVLGFLFLLFLIIGIKAFHNKKSISTDKSKEDIFIYQITQWFLEHYSADAISNGMDEEDLSIEQLYFLRWENISRLLTEQFGNLEESFLEYMSEKIYQMYFPD
ncbi:MAG: hypothetical protein K1V96_08435 [Lachnospiraceae bacterium]